MCYDWQDHGCLVLINSRLNITVVNPILTNMNSDRVVTIQLDPTDDQAVIGFDLISGSPLCVWFRIDHNSGQPIPTNPGDF